MNRRQLAFLVLANALVSFVIALIVVWAVEQRRPDLEALAAAYTPPPPALATESLAVLPPSDSAGNAVSNGAAVADPQGNGSDAPISLPTNTPLPPGEQTTYTVEQGDILSTIAGRFNVTVDELVEINRLSNPNSIYVGQSLVVPVRGDSIEVENDSGGEASAESADSTADDAVSPPSAQSLAIGAIENVGTAEEAVFLINDTNRGFSLEGWQIEKENGPTYDFDDLQLLPGNGLRVFSGSGENSTVARYWGRDGALWEPGSVAILTNEQGEVVDRYTVP